MGSVHEFLCKNLSLLVWGCWSSVSPYLLPLFLYLTDVDSGFLSKKDKNQDDFEEVDEQKFNQESVSSSIDSDTDSITSNDFHLAKSNPIDAYGDDDNGFLWDGEFDAKEGNRPGSNFLSEKDLSRKSIDTKESGGKNVNSNDKNLSNDSTNKLECLREHEELIEQLKMEIQKVRAIGLPTIFEESESPPKKMELKPWKIEEADQNVGHKLGEVHKLYKCYKERMRKFDIFSYQKMYATGFLQLNDPFEVSVSWSRSLVPEIRKHLGQSFLVTKGKKRENNPATKFIKELRSDLEVVYVGQMCLSWEILHWQYQKVLDIRESDPRGVHQFHEVAGEFQQFLASMQRFLEEEPFHGSRVQNYVKSRCVFRHLLQVPVVREDIPTNRRKARSEADGMSGDMLVEILEESIRLFWRFICGDKERRKTPLEFQKPEDSHLFMEVRKDLQKVKSRNFNTNKKQQDVSRNMRYALILLQKERKLKEQVRSGNCILKRLRWRRWKEEESDDQVFSFLCQIVYLKLVARVLQMSRLTSDQLFWCQNQLNKVGFYNRKIHVEPSLLLFPC